MAFGKRMANAIAEPRLPSYDFDQPLVAPHTTYHPFCLSSGGASVNGSGSLEGTRMAAEMERAVLGIRALPKTPLTSSPGGSALACRFNFRCSICGCRGTIFIILKGCSIRFSGVLLSFAEPVYVVRVSYRLG